MLWTPLPLPPPPDISLVIDGDRGDTGERKLDDSKNNFVSTYKLCYHGLVMCMVSSSSDLVMSMVSSSSGLVMCMVSSSSDLVMCMVSSNSGRLHAIPSSDHGGGVQAGCACARRGGSAGWLCQW